MQQKWWGWRCAVSLSLALCAQAGAQDLTATKRLPPPVSGDGASGDSFGFALATQGSFMAVGAPGDTLVVPGAANGVETGAAVLYVRDSTGYRRIAKLINGPAVGNGDNTGVAMAFAGNQLAVGIPRAATNTAAEAGLVKIFSFNNDGAAERQVLAAAQPATDERFGAALASIGDFLFVGVPRAGSGRVEVFRRNAGGYARIQVLTPEPGAGQIDFGRALAVSGDELLIGAPQAGNGAVYRSLRIAPQVYSTPTRLVLNPGASSELGAALAMIDDVAVAGAPGGDAGRVLLLSLVDNDWTQVGSASAQDATPSMRFGAALALSAERLAVGAFAALNGDGAVYAYPRAGTALGTPTRLDIANGGSADRFGISVGFVGSELLAGTDQAQVGGNRGQGSVRVYAPDGTGWQTSAAIDTGDGAMYDRYGTTVAIHGDTAVVGAFLEDTPQGGIDAGNAHWFARIGGNWLYQGELPAPDGQSEDRYGIAVATDNERIVVGAYWDIINNNLDQGSAYVFRRQGPGYVFEQKLTAALGGEEHLFGFALDIDGDTIVVGARGAFGQTGQAHLFRLQNGQWIEGATLTAPSADVGAAFGASVSIRGNTVLVGAPGASIEQVANGAAFQYTRTGTFVRSLSVATLPEAAALGFSVDTDGQRMIAGAFQDGPPPRGAAYVFDASGQLDGALKSASGQPGDALGIAVAIDGDLAAVGASGVDFSPFANIGVVKLFRRGAGGWSEGERVVAANAADGASVGRSLALSGSTLLIGAPGEAVDNPLEGSALVIELDRLFADGFE